MAGKIEARLKELGIVLPKPSPAKVAKIENCTEANGFLYVSGQVPKQDGEVKFVGKVGREFTLAEGHKDLDHAMGVGAFRRISQHVGNAHVRREISAPD